MKKIYILVLFLISIVSMNLIAQQSPTVYDSLLVEDLAGGQKMLKFGLDPLASDTIDVMFNESDLPPFPPVGAFEARFLLPPNDFFGTLSSYDDYRQATLPFTGTKEFRLSYQVGAGTVMKFTWNLPDSVDGVLQDLLGGVIVNVNMNGSGNYTLTMPGVLTKLKMVINYHSITPVELVSFGATVQGSSVNLSWQTATELNNSGFEVQRKSENSDWMNIGFVNGAGTTTEQHSYSFIDNYTQKGSVLYRLKQIDFDGTISYSKVVEVNFSIPTEFKLNQNYPNPFNPSTTVSFSIPKASDVKLSIYNQIGEQVGELVNRNLEAGSYNYTWNAQNQSSGIYFCELKTGEFKSVRKMTLVK